MSTTIDLGKLRFNWAGEWSVSTEYESNDLVRYGGDVFVYVYALAATGKLTTEVAYWSLVQEGLSWKGEYDSTVAYKPHEVVQHANNAYVCILLEPSAGATEPPNATYWELLATGVKFEGAYTSPTAAVNGAISSTTALVVDTNVGTIVAGMVVTGTGISGTVTVATVTNQNTLVLSSAQSIADDVALSFNTVYQVDDIVYYGANTYICVQNSTGNLPTATAYWNVFSHGIQWEGVYNNSSSYQKDDVVTYGANVYISKMDNVGQLPTDTAKWDVLTSGIKYTSTWDTSKSDYRIDDIATFGGNAYIATANNPTQGSDPSVNTSHWEVLAAGTRHIGNWATSTAYLKDDLVTYGAQTYKTLVTHTSGTFATDLAASKWVKFSSGTDWKGNWATSTAYKVNDIVNSGGAVYVATADHTSGTFSSDSAHWDTFANAGTVYATQTLTDGATVNWDHAFGNVALWAIAGNRTMAAPTNLAVGSSALRLTQDGTGSRTVTWNAIFKWSSGAAPVLSTAANAIDVLAFIYDGTNVYGSLVSRGAA
jgi:hypothetical protein|tara:strand:- start:775 stop:2391 length:1617 start_codon:yes stop_codon:yes gene_type:complete